MSKIKKAIKGVARFVRGVGRAIRKDPLKFAALAAGAFFAAPAILGAISGAAGAGAAAGTAAAAGEVALGGTAATLGGTATAAGAATTSAAGVAGTASVSTSALLAAPASAAASGGGFFSSGTLAAASKVATIASSASGLLTKPQVPEFPSAAEGIETATKTAAQLAAEEEAKVRKRKGAAANVLTSPLGVTGTGVSASQALLG